MPTYRLTGGFFCPQNFPGEIGTGTEGLASGASVSPFTVPADYYSNPERYGFPYETSPPWEATPRAPTIALYDDREAVGTALEEQVSDLLTFVAPRTWRDPLLYDGNDQAAGGTTLIPDVGQITWTGFAPSLSGVATVLTPGVGQITWTGFAPTLLIGATLVPGVGQITWTGFAPTVLGATHVVVGGGVKRATVPVRKPHVPKHPQYLHLAEDVVCIPGVGQIRWRGFAPTLLLSNVGEDDRLLLEQMLDPDVILALKLAGLWTT